MTTLRRLLGRSATKNAFGLIDLSSWGDWVFPRGIRRAVDSGDVADVDHAFNRISALGLGSVATVDAGGTIALTTRPLSVELWIGGGDRWWFPASEGSVRQRRVEGLPVLETRMRVGDADVVFTVWADESGDGKGRVNVLCSTETEVPVVLAVVARPFVAVGHGSIEQLRVVDNLIIADGRPLVELPREPGDVIVGSSELGDCADRLGDELVGDTSVTAADGSATLAAMVPLTPGTDLSVQIIDGRERATVAPAPLDSVVAGWKSHLGIAAHVDLPGWPKHLLPSLLSGMISSDLDRAPQDEAIIGAALAAFGLDRPAGTVVESLLDAVALGLVERSDWPMIAAAVGRHVALTSELTPALEAHGDTIGFLSGEALRFCDGRQRAELAEAMRAVGNAAAAEDIGEAKLSPTEAGLVASVTCGVDIDDEWWDARHLLAAATPVAAVAANTIVTSRRGRADDGLVELRKLAGTTWQWGSGDDPVERARIALAMRALVVRETEAGIDLLPGIPVAWFGQSVTVERMPTRHARVSFALRWHGARAALLWEVESHGQRPVQLTCRSIDPSWASADISGEVLLQAPETELG